MNEDKRLARRLEIAAKLKIKGVKEPCPRCKHSTFGIQGESAIVLEERNRRDSSTVEAIPVMVLACNNCGYITEHALGTIDLMPTPEEPKPGLFKALLDKLFPTLGDPNG